MAQIQVLAKAYIGTAVVGSIVVAEFSDRLEAEKYIETASERSGWQSAVKKLQTLGKRVIISTEMRFL